MSSEAKMFVTFVITMLVLSLLPWQFFGSIVAP